MKFRIAIAAVVISGLGFVAVMAQRPPAGPKAAVALVDVAGVSQKCARLKQSLEALKTDYESNAASFKKEADEGNKLTEKIRQMPAGTPERKKLEQDVMKKRADFELRGKRIAEDARERESKLYLGMLREMNDEMARYAQANGVQLMLRLDQPPLDLNDPRSVLQEIQKTVVYHRGVDITPPLAEAMNRRTGPLGSVPKTANQGTGTKTR